MNKETKEFIELTKPSDLLRVVIKAAGELDREKYYPEAMAVHLPVLKRGRFFIPRLHHCQVCNAGVVLAGVVGKRPTRFGNMTVRKWSVSRRLRAIDSLRIGDLENAFRHLYGSHPHVEDKLKDVTRPVNAWYHGWEEFDKHIKDLERYANDLEERGY